MKNWILIALLAMCAIPARAQGYTAPPEDAQFGIISVPCSNANTAFKIDTTTYPLNPTLCTPSGHVLPGTRGVFVMDPNLGTTNDESGPGHNYLANVQAKYGSTANALTQESKNLVAWGMNSLAPYANVNLKAPEGPVTKVPAVYLMFSSEYALNNRAGWGTGAAKDFFYYLGGSGATTTWGGFHSSTGMCDWEDPNFAAMVNGILTNDSGFVALGAASAVNKGYLEGISTDESDGLHGLGAGPDFATTPSGNNDFALGYVAFFLPPVSYANSHQAEIYPNAQVYLKQRWQTLVLAAHGGTIAGVNSSWLSSYTTKDSSGTCVGPQPSGIICAATIAGAETAYTGTGSQLSFTGYTVAHTVVSKYSLGVFVGGVLVGGDTGAGALYGPNLTGTINYSTGAFAPTFSSGHAPGVGIAVTISYIANGWGIGTGFMDEDCRAGNASYCGTGTNSVTVNLTGIPAAVQADINALTQDQAQFYASTTTSTINAWAAAHGFTGGIINFGGTTTGTWSAPSSRYVLAGLSAGGQQVYIAGGQTEFTQAMFDFMNTWAPGMPIVIGSYRTANADSPYSWKGTGTKSGITASMVVPTPLNMTTGSLIDIRCTDATYNMIQAHASSIVGGTITWTPNPGPPSSSSTPCNAFWDDNNVGGFPTQAARAFDFQTKVSVMPAITYTLTGLHPVIGFYWWQYNDNEAEQLNWGPCDVRDNCYNGVEAVNPIVTCLAPNAAFNCGGELRGPYGGGAIAAIQAVNTAWDNATLALVGIGPTGCTVGPGIALGPGVVTNKLDIDVCKGRIEWSRPRHSHFSQSF